MPPSRARHGVARGLNDVRRPANVPRTRSPSRLPPYRARAHSVRRGSSGASSRHGPRRYNPSSVPRNSKSEASVSWITQRAWAGTSSPYTRRFQDLPPSSCGTSKAANRCDGSCSPPHTLRPANGADVHKRNPEPSGNPSAKPLWSTHVAPRSWECCNFPSSVPPTIRWDAMPKAQCTKWCSAFRLVASTSIHRLSPGAVSPRLWWSNQAQGFPRRPTIGL